VNSSTGRASIVPRVVAWSLALALAGVVAAGARSGAPRVSAAPTAQTGTGVTYKLVDRWANERWKLTPGRFSEAADISSAPDGTIYVLDTTQPAIHVLERDGTPRAVLPIDTGDPDGSGGWIPRRLDVGFDGDLYLLSDSNRPLDGGIYPSRVERLTPGGQATMLLVVGALVPRAYVDIAVRPDGRIYLSRAGLGNPYIEWPGPTPAPTGGPRPDNSVEVFTRAGTYLASLAPPEMALPGNLDVDADGTIYVINRVPSPWGEPPPGATVTPRPSLADPPRRPGADPAAAPAQATAQPTATPPPDRIEGVIIFAPDHHYVETVRFSGAEDIAARPAGVFLSRNVEIFALREREPLYFGQAGRVVNAFFSRTVFNLDVTADGRLLASINHCYLQGVLVFDRPADRPATPAFVGANDAPYLEGPPFPVRLAASDEVAVLQGRFSASGPPDDRSYVATNYLFEAQSVQRWTRRGLVRSASPLRSQLGVCAGSDSWWTRDVAIDGRDIYTVDPGLVQLRPDDRLPAWSRVPSAEVDPDLSSQLVAVAADDGRAAVLDAGTASVYALDRAGTLLAAWPVARGQVNALPSDLALSGDRVYLADLGRGRILVRGLLDGADLGEWPIHDGPRAIAAGPTGDVFVLGRGGWGFQYHPDGTLAAAWAMPDRAFDALDIAVDVDGRVYVSYVETSPMNEADQGRDIIAFGIVQSGIWIFEPAPADPVPPTDPAACLAVPHKTAGPARIPLGDEVEVTLSVDGRCPGTYDPVQLLVVLDTSRSMNFNDAVGRARDVLSDVLARLDPRAAEVGLVTFEEGATLKAPLSRDIATTAALAVAQGATGDTHLAPALELARQELTGPRGNPAARRIVLVVTDGVYYDDPLDSAYALIGDGVEIYALVLPTYEYAPSYRDALEILVTNPRHVFVDPTPRQVAELADGMIRYRAPLGLFERITVDDVVPANMRYIEGSAVPPATWDAARRVLSWTPVRAAASEVILLRYRLEPLAVGTWPTNVEATAPYRDVLGHDGRLVFPIPEVEVYGPQPPTRSVYLPFAARGMCFRRDKPLDVVLVMDTSSTMRERAPSGEAKIAAAQAAARTFLGELRWSIDQAALVAFDITARRAQGLTGDRTALERAIDALVTTEGTHIDLGLAEARRVLAEGGRRGARPVVVLLTDGLNNAGPAPVLAEARALKGAGAVMYTIGLGQDVDADLLRAVATAPERYFASPTAGDLASIYRQVSEKIACDNP
jgi:Mg-chelatase subunit ChlD